MQKACQTNKITGHRQRKRPVGLIVLCAAGAALLILSGCKSTSEAQSKEGDILFGERPYDKPAGVASSPTPPPQNRAGMSPQPAPAIASKSNAAMVIPPDPLPGAKNPLDIPDTQTATTAPASWMPKPDGTLAGGLQPVPVILKVPEAAPAVVTPVPVSNSTAPQPKVQLLPSVAPAGGSEMDQLQAKLKQRGVLWQEQQQLADGVHFTCAVANPKDPTFSRVYETTAQDLPAAINQVLEQMDQK
jgi:hypothetical protein